MVNASLNWASIVGIVLAVGGALLYFMRSFKPALARDYDVFFAAVGLLCGGILIFQGWRLDPILQFGQFLLAGTTVFFAYESVRLRSVTTEQARRSSYFDDDEPPIRPRMGGGRDYGDNSGRFDEPQPLRRRIRSQDEEESQEDFYRQRRPPARAAIPERAASRRGEEERWERPGERDRYGRGAGERDPFLGGSDRPGAPERGSSERSGTERGPSRFRASGPSSDSDAFGARRRERDAGLESRRGSRPTATADTMPRSSRRAGSVPPRTEAGGGDSAGGDRRPGIPEGRPLRSNGSGPVPPRNRADVSDAEFSPLEPSASSRNAADSSGAESAAPGAPAAPRDNSSRFDD
ncbi:MAG: Ycf66 family protein [Cyanobacteriota bacterium]